MPLNYLYSVWSRDVSIYRTFIPKPWHTVSVDLCCLIRNPMQEHIADVHDGDDIYPVNGSPNPNSAPRPITRQSNIKIRE